MLKLELKKKTIFLSTWNIGNSPRIFSHSRFAKSTNQKYYWKMSGPSHSKSSIKRITSFMTGSKKMIYNIKTNSSSIY